MLNFEKLNNKLMTNNLFGNFQHHTKTQWKEQVIKDLKGKDFEEILLWHIDENMTIDAYHNQEDTFNVPLSLIQQTQNQRVNGSWQYQESIKFTNERDCNSLIINDLLSGANSFSIDFSGMYEWKVEVRSEERRVGKEC